MPYYTIHHLTRFEYASPVRESVMEARMRPRDGESQTVIDFDLSVSPRVRTSDYRDAFGNHVHHFDVPQTHMYETLTANATVRVDAPAPPPQRLDADAWDRLASEADDLAVWQMTLPSAFCHRSDKLEAFAQQIDARRRDCPLQTAMHLNQQLSEHLRYEPQ
jgi:transglutaminase-like putative cysteine protease